jgi:hypothetical protein
MTGFHVTVDALISRLRRWLKDSRIRKMGDTFLIDDRKYNRVELVALAREMDVLHSFEHVEGER